MNKLTFQQATRSQVSVAELWTPLFNAAFEEFGVTLRRDKAAIIGLAASESDKFQRLTESFDFHIGALRRVFGKRFSPYQAAMLGRQMGEKVVPDERQRAIANLAYGGRLGNGPSEGWNYRGRGVIPIRGKRVYKEAGELVGLDLVENPDLMLTPEVAARVACARYVSRECIGVAELSEIEDALQLDVLTEDDTHRRAACFRRALLGLA